MPGGNRMKQEKKYCNACGRELKMRNGILLEDVLAVQKEWGYFSEKDTTVDSFRICESCYDHWTASFQIPLHKKKKTEVI